jgi:hypothetical protein
MIKVTTKDIEEYGINMFGHFVSCEAIHSMETDKVSLKLVFNNTVYQLEADFNDFLTEQGCANAWSSLILRVMLNHERGTKMMNVGDDQINEMLKGSTNVDK